MCVVYLAWESDINIERLKTLLQWHSISVGKKVIQQSSRNLLQIESENLNRRSLCSFGKYGLVYYEDNFPGRMQMFQSMSSLSNHQKQDIIQHDVIGLEKDKRWQLFDAEWWLACMRTLVDEFDTMGILYTFGDELSDFSSVLSKPKHTVSVQELCVDTLLYLPEKTILEIKKSTVADNPAIP